MKRKCPKLAQLSKGFFQRPRLVTTGHIQKTADFTPITKKGPAGLAAGGYDETVLRLNESALSRLQCEKQLEVVPRATHLFEEEGTLDQVARLASDWFQGHLR